MRKTNDGVSRLPGPKAYFSTGVRRCNPGQPRRPPRATWRRKQPARSRPVRNRAGRGYYYPERVLGRETNRRNDIDADHVRSFLDAIKSRKDPIDPVEVGHSTASLRILGTVQTPRSLTR